MQLQRNARPQVLKYMDAREQLGCFIECNEPIEQLWQGAKALHENAQEGTPALIPMSALMGGK